MSVIENTSSSESIPNGVDTKNDDSKVSAETSEKVLENNTEKEENSTRKEEKVEKKIEIPTEDYSVMSQENLLVSIKKLISNYPVQLIKTQVEEIKNQFNKNFDEKAAESKTKFLEEGGNEIDFHYTTPLKREFNDHYFNYRDKRNKYYETLKNNQENNLKNRLQIIEDLKVLIAAEGSVGKKFDVFKELKEKWHQAGPIPRDKNNVVWNTFYHHVDKFYEVVHLDREFRELDYKHNLDQKVKILERAKELTLSENVTHAFRELQTLHKIWKEEIGPVAKEFKELLWEKFSELTKVIHDKRQEYFAEQDAKQLENLAVRKSIIEQIEQLSQVERKSHKEWQTAINQVNELHEKFKTSGRVPNEQKNSIWDEFRAAERAFNSGKNGFYKSAKSDQLENLKKKKELIALAEENKDSEDFDATTELMKKIQSDWKKIGHVPRKDSDKVWKEFKDACNYYFDRLHGLKAAANEKFEKAYEAKKAFIEGLKDFEVSDLSAITSKIEEWKKIGTVPSNKRKIEDQFSTLLDGMFSKLNLNRQEAEMIKFETRLADIKASEDSRLLNDERNFIRKRLTEIKQEILQLENNLQFFKHADKTNPLVADVYKKIDKHNSQLEIWDAKWRKIKNLSF